MCGIGLLLTYSTASDTDNSSTIHNALHRDVYQSWNESLSKALASRGPDVPCQQCQFDGHGRRCNSSADNATADGGGGDDDGWRDEWSLTLHASVLHMRGLEAQKQPLVFSVLSDGVDNNDCALCWNGECYTYQNGDEDDGTIVELSVEDNTSSTDDSKDEAANTSDTLLVKNLISESITTSRQSNFNDATSEHEAVANAIGRIHGEFSFLLFVRSTSQLEGDEHSRQQGCVYYGRDCLGRRSLLGNRPLDGVVVLSSVAMDMDNCSDIGWEELPPGIVYRMNVCTGEVTSMAMPRVVNNDIGTMISSIVPTPSPSEYNRNTMDNAAKGLLQLLDKAIQRRVMHSPLPKSQSSFDASVAVLFSGGIDSVVLAALCDRHVPPHQTIDLINVSFYDKVNHSTTSASPDRLAAIHSYNEMTERWPERKWRFTAVDVAYEEVLRVEKHLLLLIRPLDSTMDFNIATAFWFAARGKGKIVRREEAKQLVVELESQGGMQGDTSFSQEPLLRFAKKQHSDTSKDKDGHSPKQSRQTCIREGCTRPAPSDGCVFNACKFCCGKLQGPISKFLGKSARCCPVHNHDEAATPSGKKKIRHSPSTVATDPSINAITTSAAKILLSGVGADEQMAGYGRHRSTFLRGGYTALKGELRMEVRRLWTRNLGRDDRCLSDHGKEARFPYLDEDVVAYLEALPLELKCDMNQPQGIGDKLILRRVAKMIGVHECSSLVKRAIQFGSRIAKVSDKSRFGSQRQATGQAKHITSNLRDNCLRS